MRNKGSAVLVAAIGGWAIPFGAGCATTPSQEIDVQSATWRVEGAQGRRFDTAHTRLFSTIDDEAFESALPRFLEDAYAEYARLLPPTGGEADPLVFHIFGDEGSWRRFVRARFGDLYTAARNSLFAGFTDDTGSYLYYQRRAPTIAAAVHEGFHQFLQTRHDVDPPQWLEEGLACAFEGFNVIGDRLTFSPGRNTFRTDTLCAVRNTERLLPFDLVLTMDHAKLGALRDPRDGDRFYAQAWALVAMLRADPNGEFNNGFARMLSDMADGSFNLRVSAAGLGERQAGTDPVLNAYFPATATSIEATYNQFLDGMCRR